MCKFAIIIWYTYGLRLDSCYETTSVESECRESGSQTL